MAVTVTRYNHTAKKIANGEITAGSLLVVLLSSGYTFDAAHTNYTDVSANEVSGNGWDAGGEALANEAWTVVTTNDAMLDADDLAVTASGGPIGPATQAVIMEAGSGDLLLHIDFGESKTADDGTQFKFNFNASGIIRITD